jgi:hypothetical protein
MRERLLAGTLVLVALLAACQSACCQQSKLALPTREQSEQARDGFKAFGDGEHALRPNKKCWAAFAVVHAAAFAALFTDMKVTHQARENAPSEVPAVAAVTALDFVLFKTVNPLMSLGGGVWAVQHYSRDPFKR